MSEMIEITPEAKSRIEGMMRGETHKTVRIIVGEGEATSPLVKEKSLAFIKGADPLPDDTVVEYEGIQILLDEESVENLEEAPIDFTPSFGFTAKTQVTPQEATEGSVEEQFQSILDEHINPAVAMHGGHVRLLEIKDNNAYVEFGGGCQGCGMVNVTLKQGVEVVVQEFIPDIENIYDVTDHANGTNPYYQPSSK